MVNFSNFCVFRKENQAKCLVLIIIKLLLLLEVSFPNKSSSKSSFSIFVQSDFAQEGSGCTSMKIPSVPICNSSFGNGFYQSGLPPVTPRF